MTRDEPFSAPAACAKIVRVPTSLARIGFALQIFSAAVYIATAVYATRRTLRQETKRIEESTEAITVLHTALAQMNDTLAATVADENARIAHLETAVFGRSSAAWRPRLARKVVAN